MPFAITPELLATGQTYRRELLAMPVVELEPIIKHMTPRYGIQGKESVGTGTTGAELRPYKTAKGAKDTSGIELRTIETFLGDVVEEFDPQVLWSTIYGSTIGTNPTDTEIAKQMAMLMAMSVGENLALSIFTAKRNDSGETTKDLFDGFETIIEKEIAAGKIAAGKGNFIDLGAINQANVVDMLKRAYKKGTHEVLRGKKVKMFLPTDLYDLYNEGYKAETGAVAYNTEFKKTFLEGSDQKCELVPMSGMSQKRLIITPKSNMLIGMDQFGLRETVRIRECDNPKLVQFFMCLYFGTQFESINERLFSTAQFTISE